MIVVQQTKSCGAARIVDGSSQPAKTYVVPHLSILSLGSLTEAMRILHQPELCTLHVDAKNCARFLEARILATMLMTLPACTLWQSIDFGEDLTVTESMQLLEQMRAQRRDVPLSLHPPP